MVPTAVPEDVQPAQESSSSVDDGAVDPQEDEETIRAGVYIAFSDGVLTNGETKLLFFHAPWCPFCVANDRVLNTLYGDNQLSRSTYKIDFDTATELRARYGVVTQDTVVLVDGNGDAITSIFHPSESEFLEVLQ